MSKRVFHLRPSARLQRYLGQELIADPNLAVIEFVKNAYDAGASDVSIEFSIAAPESSLMISDNGVGMTLPEFESNWMQPGFSTKSPDAPAALVGQCPDTDSGHRQATRTALGEKGIGRLAAGRLGEILEVFTRSSLDEAWLHVTFDWNDFDDMTKSMDEIDIPYDSADPPADCQTRSGTVILIRNLRLKWDSFVPGRPAPGRSRTRLGRLKQDLELLLRPLDDETAEFTVSLDSDSVAETGDRGTITPRSASRSAHYRYEFNVSIDADGETTVTRHLGRSSEIASTFAESEDEHLGRMLIGEGEAKKQNRPQSLLCGEFSGTFFYDPPPKGKRARQVVGHGVLIYRDGAMVEPYGLDNNDWLGVEARKAQRQGHALIQPTTFSGEIRISRENNPKLLDMANRQGLIDNVEAREFIAHAQAEFRFFEAKIAPELQRQWRSKSQQASESAEQRLGLAHVRMRMVAHALRQPLMGLGVEATILESLLTDDALPSQVRQQLAKVIAATRHYVQRADTLLSRLENTGGLNFMSVTVPELLDAAVAKLDDVADESEVDLRIECDTDRSLMLPRDAVEDAISELLRNALESPRPNGGGVVTVHAQNRGRRDVEIEIRDDGSGLEGVSPGTPLAQINLATKGRPSGGLVVVADSVMLARGRVDLIDNGTDGATFLVRLPGGVEGLEKTNDN